MQGRMQAAGDLHVTLPSQDGFVSLTFVRTSDPNIWFLIPKETGCLNCVFFVHQRVWQGFGSISST